MQILWKIIFLFGFLLFGYSNIKGCTIAVINDSGKTLFLNNEDFDITSNQWGFGLGLISFFDISRKLDFVLTTGLDYYLSSELGGHDTTYSPDGEDVNPRLDYDYDDADEAVNQPNLQLRFLLGINYHF